MIRKENETRETQKKSLIEATRTDCELDGNLISSE